MATLSYKLPENYSFKMNGDTLNINNVFIDNDIYYKNTPVDSNAIIDIDEIVENKVTEVKFGDGTKEKMVLQDPDVFCMEDCLYIALAKKLYKHTFTFEGIEHAAKEMRYVKYYNGIVNNGLKLWKKIKQKKEKELLDEKLEKERLERHKKKRALYKAKREEKRKKEMIDAQVEIAKEAYIQLMRELNTGDNNKTNNNK